MLTDLLEDRLAAQERRATWLTRAVVVLALVILAGLPMVAMAGHVFLDVPNTNQFHTDIERVADARITAGCGGGNYCPADPVTREQMAAFLSRTGSRAAWGRSNAFFELGLNPEAATTLAQLTITPGNVTGGTGFVLVVASTAGSISSLTGCPCSARFYVYRASGPFQYGYAQMATDVGSDSGSIVLVDAVPTGVPVTYTVEGYRSGGTGTVYGYANVVAIFVPFSEDGDDDLDVVITSTPMPVPN